MTYKVEFELTEATQRQEVKETIDKSVTPKAQPTKRGFIESKTSKPIMLAYATYSLFNAVTQAQKINDMTLRGDNLAAKMTQEKNARRDKFVSSAFSFTMGIAIKGTIGGLFIVNEALKIASQAMAIAMQNKQLLEQSRQERYINQFEQSRFVRNTTTESIRW